MRAALNRTEHPEVGVFENSDTDIRQVVDVGGGKNPSASPISCGSKHTSAGSLDFFAMHTNAQLDSSSAP
jgi:hypothetical protein